jgi:hypothetical protein
MNSFVAVNSALPEFSIGHHLTGKSVESPLISFASYRILILLTVCLLGLLIYFIWFPRNLVDDLVITGWELFSTPTSLDLLRQLRILDVHHFSGTKYCEPGQPNQNQACQYLHQFPAWINSLTGEVVTGVQTKRQLRLMVNRLRKMGF